MYVFLFQHLHLVLWGIYTLKNGIARSHGNSMCNLLRNGHIFSNNYFLILIVSKFKNKAVILIVKGVYI